MNNDVDSECEYLRKMCYNYFLSSFLHTLQSTGIAMCVVIFSILLLVLRYFFDLLFNIASCSKSGEFTSLVRRVKAIRPYRIALKTV